MIGILVGMGVVSVGGAVVEKVMEVQGKGDPSIVNEVVKTTLFVTMGLVIIKSVIEVIKIF